MSKAFAVIPIKSKSSRLESKNKLLLGGYPLWFHTYEVLRDSNAFDMIIISTDISKSYFQQWVQFNSSLSYHQRPQTLCKDNVHAMYVVKDVINTPSHSINADSFVYMALPTSPFRRKESILKSIDLIKNSPTIESVVAITKSNKPSYSIRYIDPKNGLLSKFTQNINLQEQDSSEYLVLFTIHRPSKRFIDI